MKIRNSKFHTTTEILRDFFQLEDRLLYQMDEAKRYEKIYQHLVKLGAKYSGATEFKNKQFQQFKYQDSLYLIPNQIFQEMENRIFQILDRKSSKSEDKVVSLFKKAN